MENKDSDEEYTYEREGLFEAGREFESEDEGASNVSDSTVSRDTVIKAYNFEVSVAIAGRETVNKDDQMEGKFSEAVEEIKGKKAFSCAICNKVCKLKGGLMRHRNSKHSDASFASELMQVPLCEGTVVLMIESIKTDLIEENLYGTDIKNSSHNIFASEALFNALKPCITHFVTRNTRTS